MQEIGENLGVQTQENQFQLMSAIKSSDETLMYMDEHSEKMEIQQFNNKIAYYNKLSLHNREMLTQVKQIDAELNSELKRALTKKDTIQGRAPIKINHERSKSVMIKYKELDTVKKQLEIKLLQKTPLQGFQNQATNLKSLYKQKCADLESKIKTLKNLQAIAENKEQQDILVSKNNSILSDSYMTVVKQLKQKLKSKTSKVYEEKQKFIDESKKRRVTNASTTATKSKIDDAERLPSHVEQLKVKYEGIGYRIEALKGHKKNLLLQKQALEERRKYLQKLKLKRP